MVPLILATLGPMLAKQGLGLLSNVFHGVLDDGTKKIAEKIKASTGIEILNKTPENPLTPEEVTKLKEFENEENKMILEYIDKQAAREFEEQKAYLEDKQNARDMFKATGGKLQQELAQKIFGQSQWMIPVLILSNVAAIGIAEYFQISPGLAAGINTALGLALGRAWDERKTVIEFCFGSSQGSKNKDTAKKENEIAKIKSQLKGE